MASSSAATDPAAAAAGVLRLVPWPRSTVTEADLERLMGKGLICPCTDAQRPEWVVPPRDHDDPHPDEGYVVSFIAYHERRLGSPPSHFCRALLFSNGLELHKLTPNSFTQASIFIALCEGYFGVLTHWDLWRRISRVDLYTKAAGPKQPREIPCAGGCGFVICSAAYIPCKTHSFNKDWHNGWFYLRNDGDAFPKFTGRMLTAPLPQWEWQQ